MNNTVEYITIEKSIPNKLKEWCYTKITSITGELPEFEEKEIKEIIKPKKSILKKHKTLRFIILPIVIILITIDESYIRIKDFLKKIDEIE